MLEITIALLIYKKNKSSLSTIGTRKKSAKKKSQSSYNYTTKKRLSRLFDLIEASVMTILLLSFNI